MASGPRQGPGLACEVCRKRKLRCDRGSPQCGTCANAGLKCEFVEERLPRGPKKGSVKLLRNRIFALELQLQEAQLGKKGGAEEHVVDISSDFLEKTSDDGGVMPHTLTMVPSNTPSPPMLDRTSFSRATFLNEMMCDDLDQLYFERVHAIVPILNKYRYFTWAKSSDLGPYRVCLQNAMWTLAMSHSSQFEHVREFLYTETRQMLDKCDFDEDDMKAVYLEQVQAWILITFYEFFRCSYRRAWLSAGRVFRLVQLLRLHNVDGPMRDTVQLEMPTCDENILAEEKRRAFWVAYCLDRFVSVDNGLPLTLNEDEIYTGLPCLEAEFATGQPTQITYLSEAMTGSTDYTFISPLTECAILVTLYGRALKHHHVSAAEQVFNDLTQDFWSRHEWIDTKLAQRMEFLTLSYPTITVFTEPMLLLTYMVLQTTILHLYKTMELVANRDGARNAVMVYRPRALSAAREIARLTKEQAHIGFFRGHVFMPAAIFMATERFEIERNMASLNSPRIEDRSSVNIDLECCLEALRKVQSVNNLAGHYLGLLESAEMVDSQC